MKRLLLVLVLLMTAGSLFAAELKVSGDAFVRGTTWSEDKDTAPDKVQYSYFDYDFNLNLAFVANEKATIFTKLTYDRNVKGDLASAGTGTGYVADGNNDWEGDIPNTSYTDVPSDALNIERAYINYKFAPFLQLNTGLMGGGTWASSFGDNEANVMRVQFIGALSPDMVFIATYEKRDEYGATVKFKDSEKNDDTYYYLASRMKFDAITLMPLLVYGTKGVNHDGSVGALGTNKYDIVTTAFQLGVNGDFGMFGFESEFHYAKVAADKFPMLNGGKDIKTMGAYINAFAKIDAIKAGLIYAYGSADIDDGKFAFGADFTPLIIVTDEVTNGANANGLAGFSLYMIYGEYTMDKFTVGASVGYGANNADWATNAAKDASFMEYNLKGSYAFDANTTYELGFAYATLSDWAAANDDQTLMKLYHKFSVKF